MDMSRSESEEQTAGGADRPNEVAEPPKLSAAERRAAIEAIERPKAELFETSDVPKWERRYASQGLHSGIPAPIGVGFASLAGRLAWKRNDDQREQALHRARVFTGSEDTEELETFARENLRENRMMDEIFWRPWLAPKPDKIEGIEELDKARKRRGVIVAGVHVGPMPHLQLALALHLQRDEKTLYISRWAKIEDERHQSGSRALYLPAKVERLEAAGARFIGRGGSFPIFEELLKRKEVCWLAIDTAGGERGRVVELAGRKVRLATGIAALARQTNSPILPAVIYRDRWKTTAKLREPLQPRQFRSDETLHDRLAETASEMIAEHPDQVMPDLVTAMEWGKV